VWNKDSLERYEPWNHRIGVCISADFLAA